MRWLACENAIPIYVSYIPTRVYLICTEIRINPSSDEFSALYSNGRNRFASKKVESNFDQVGDSVENSAPIIRYSYAELSSERRSFASGVGTYRYRQTTSIQTRIQKYWRIIKFRRVSIESHEW